MDQKYVWYKLPKHKSISNDRSRILTAERTVHLNRLIGVIGINFDVNRYHTFTQASTHNRQSVSMRNDLGNDAQYAVCWAVEWTVKREQEWNDVFAVSSKLMPVMPIRFTYVHWNASRLNPIFNLKCQTLVESQ